MRAVVVALLKRHQLGHCDARAPRRTIATMAPEPPVTESVSKLSELDHLPGESIKVIAQHVGIESLADEVARALAPDVEYSLREVIQDACKFMRQSKRVRAQHRGRQLVAHHATVRAPLRLPRGRRAHPVPGSARPPRAVHTGRTRRSTSRISSPRSSRGRPSPSTSSRTGSRSRASSRSYPRTQPRWPRTIEPRTCEAPRTPSSSDRRWSRPTSSRRPALTTRTSRANPEPTAPEP